MGSNALHDYIAGAVGGAAGLVVGHPFDTTKVQLQTRQTSTAYTGTWDAIRNINKQGWRKGFFRGLGFPLASYGLINSVFFGVYGHSLRYLSEGRAATYWQVFAAGAVGGAVQLMIACPVDVVKVVLQSQIPHTTGSTNNVSIGKSFYRHPYFQGPLECVRSLYCRGGLHSCYSGFKVMGCRDIPASASYFVIYEWTFSSMMERQWSDRRGIIAGLFAGGMAGVFSWLLIMPLDVIKSLIQSDLTGTKYRGLVDCSLHLYRTGGISAFYTGALATSLRAFPVNAVTFLFYGQTMLFLKSRNSSNCEKDHNTT